MLSCARRTLTTNRANVCEFFRSPFERRLADDVCLSQQQASPARRRASLAIETSAARCDAALADEERANVALKELLALVSANDESVVAMKRQVEALQKQMLSKKTYKKDREKMEGVVAAMQADYDALVVTQRALQQRLDVATADADAARFAAATAKRSLVRRRRRRRVFAASFDRRCCC